MKIIGILLFLGCIVFSLEAQAAYPRTYGGLTLGMGLDEAKKVLSQSADFLWKGDADVSLLARPNTSLIDVEGSGYVSRGLLQFYQGKLYILTVELNPQELDYYTMYSTFTKKYGEPTSLDPSIARWENDGVRVSLEKPLLVRYIDKPVFLKLQKEGERLLNVKKFTRDKFLEGF